jgi:hypothetical protein
MPLAGGFEYLPHRTPLQEGRPSSTEEVVASSDSSSSSSLQSLYFAAFQAAYGQQMSGGKRVHYPNLICVQV